MDVLHLLLGLIPVLMLLGGALLREGHLRGQLDTRVGRAEEDIGELKRHDRDERDRISERLGDIYKLQRETKDDVAALRERTAAIEAQMERRWNGK